MIIVIFYIVLFDLLKKVVLNKHKAAGNKTRVWKEFERSIRDTELRLKENFTNHIQHTVVFRNT